MSGYASFADIPTEGTELSDDDWEQAFTEARADLSEVAGVLRYWGVSPEGYASMDIAATFRLKDGRYAALTGWCDTSGWDCQGGAEWYEADTEDVLVRTRLTQTERRALGYEPDGATP